MLFYDVDFINLFSWWYFHRRGVCFVRTAEKCTLNYFGDGNGSVLLCLLLIMKISQTTTLFSNIFFLITQFVFRTIAGCLHGLLLIQPGRYDTVVGNDTTYCLCKSGIMAVLVFDDVICLSL